MGKEKIGVLLVNLGTPDSPATKDVRKYLREFLMDGRVIDIPAIPRFILVNGIIAPLRAPKSAKEYAKLWVERGSPLKFYGYDVRDMLQKSLGDDYKVTLAMRYQNPSIEEGLNELKAVNVKRIIVIPLFPQYASASTGSVSEKVNELVSKWQIIPSVAHINQFMDHPKFLEAFANNGKALMEKQDYDHVIFSYHGLPERHIRKGSVGNQCQLGSCCSVLHERNRYCYRAQCFYTSRELAKRLGLKEDGYTTTFQSRLGKDPWIKPYTDEVLEELPEKGIKKALVFSPAFISDCLETTIEVGEEFKEEFMEAGGEVWDLVPSLNDSETWIECLEDLVKTA
ncbi:ferrochelatase [Roseivirga misakiensis]|uniref:Ferrochelatase n=1 Tax=Roseivirga misakiensis TaxID=1563681 RepID=A0A1E5T6J5_9BACT|nr:ferrochelatase [Roseivirga misakiensis]OEK06917.1 ferrochelatase [Roseivirga misakiensis]